MPHIISGIIRRLLSYAIAERLKKKQYYLKNGSAVLEELLALCDGNCRIPLRYFSAYEIEKAIKNPEKRIILFGSCMVKFDKHLVLNRFLLQAMVEIITVIFSEI